MPLTFHAVIHPILQALAAEWEKQSKTSELLRRNHLLTAAQVWETEVKNAINSVWSSWSDDTKRYAERFLQADLEKVKEGKETVWPQSCTKPSLFRGLGHGRAPAVDHNVPYTVRHLLLVCPSASSIPH
ncbi:hypothetical protein JCM11641_006349 [Rhodosporidiobolus odoratus]